MNEREIELVDDEEGMLLTLRGHTLAMCTERADAKGVTVEQLVERVLWGALADERL